MDNQQLMKAMEKDLNILISKGFQNACVVKKVIEGTRQLEPHCIQFSFWFDDIVLPLRAYRRENGNYDVYFKKKLIQKDIEITKMEKTLNNYEVTHTTNKMSIMNSDLVDATIERKKKSNKKGGKK